MKSKVIALPYVIWMLIFILVPLSLIVFYAFFNENGQFALDELLNFQSYIPILLKSLWLALISTLICFIIGYPLAFILSRTKPVSQRTLLLLLMLPMWMNFLLRTYAWMTLLEKNGLINQFLKIFGIGPFDMINTSGAVVLGMVYNYLPFMVLPLYSIMVKIEKPIIQAAQDLGANSFHIITKIVMPLSLPGIISGITMVFVPSVSTFIISRMLGGGSNILIGDLIEMRFLGASYDPHAGSAIALILMLIILIIMSIMNRFDKEEMEGLFR